MAFSNVMLAPPGGITGMQQVNALLQGNLNRYNTAADTALKQQQAQMLPYQYRMQNLPMMLAMAQGNPDLQKELVNSITQNVPGGNNLQGFPGQSQTPFGGGLIGLISNLFNKNSSNPLGQNNQQLGTNNIQNTSNGNNSNNNPSSGDNTTPLLPASQGNPVIGKMMADYNKTPYKAGDLFWDPVNNRAISASDPAVIQQAQQGLSGLQRIDPLIRRLATEARPLQSGWTRLLGGAESFANQYGAGTGSNVFDNLEKLNPDIGSTSQDLGVSGSNRIPTIKARLESDLGSAPEQLIRIYGLKPGKYTHAELAKVIEPVHGETADQYTQRVMQKLTQLQQEEGAPYKEQLQKGFDVSSDATAQEGPKKTTIFNTSKKVLMIAPDGKTQGYVPQENVSKAIAQGYRQAQYG